MASDWRFVCRHVRYWRGTIQKWSTVYRFQGTPFTALTVLDAETVANNDLKMCYAHASTEGGLYQVEIYDVAAGGPAIVTHNYFDPEAPGSWTGYPTTVWTPLTVNTETQAEVALCVEWRAGLSSTGKSVYLRKFYHSVPISSGVAGAADVSSANITALNAQALVLTTCLAARGLGLGTPGRTSPSAPVTKNYYYNHQMPRGRRRAPLVTANGTYKGPTIEGRPLVTIPD